MSQPKQSPAERYAAYQRSQLERELAQAESQNKLLQRQLKKVQSQLTQIQQAYDKTVENMQDIVRENLQLAYECERLRVRTPFTDDWTDLPPEMTNSVSPDEINAIRKAMARLHHPDAGGSHQRMQYWNMMLDQLQRRRS